MGKDTDLPFWQVNVPQELRDEKCPEYLRNLSEKDKSIIGTKDEDFTYVQWPKVKEYIQTNRIDLFVRKPTDLRKYREYTHQLIQQHGSIMNFVVSQRLGWTDLTPQGAAPFTGPSDIKILYNDWPYGIDPSIAHLVVWTKFELEDDPATDDLTPAARRQIDAFVRRTFCSSDSGVAPEDVVWFKNWRSLKSVHAVEHFHVMLRGAPAHFLARITGGDVPLAAKVEIGEGTTSVA